VNWAVDVTSAYRSDLVGLESEADQAISSAILEWLNQGPPRRNSRSMAGITFYEEVIADRYLVAYMVDDVRQRFLMMWLRDRPGSQLG
jgi:hypothetical protein